MKLLPSLLLALALGASASAQETAKVTNEPSLAPRKVGEAQKIFNGNELTAKFRLIPGDEKGFANSGIQYRSRVNQPTEFGPVVSGYQADCEAGQTYTGILYEERGRGILAKRGEKVVITADPENPKKPKIEVTGSVGESAAIQATVKNGEWIDYKIVAKGNHLQQWINGLQTVDVTDNDPKAATEGIIALQIHAGPPMTVEFKDLSLKELK
jgi:hypothetical protein